MNSIVRVSITKNNQIGGYDLRIEYAPSEGSKSGTFKYFHVDSVIKGATMLLGVVR